MNRKEFLSRMGPLPKWLDDRARATSMDPKAQSQYTAQLGQMWTNGKKWLAEHPGAEVKVQFNFPNTVSVIGSISEAIENNFVSTNVQGLELLKALWPRWDDPTEPTVLMVRAVIESLNQ